MMLCSGVCSSAAAPFLFLLVPLAATQYHPIFDGKIRKTADGRYEAYLVPPAASNHASFLELLPNDDLALAWFSGSAEGADNCSFVLTLLPNGSLQWSRASLVSRRPGYSNQNPVLFLDPTGQVLYLFYSQQLAAGQRSVVGSAEAQANIWMLQSFDGGVSWTTPRDVFTKNGSFDRNRIIYSLKGDWLFPIYYSAEKEEDQFSTVMISWDQQTWVSHPIPHSNYLIQPSIIRPLFTQFLLRAFLRDRCSQHIYTSTSTDDGLTWSDPTRTGLPNNDAAIQACVLTNGHVVLAYNPTTGPRVPLRVSLSEDGGLTWPYSRDLESGGGTEFSYPSLLETGHDGFIHVSYTFNRQTIKYVRFQESWIKNEL